jgi:hypothetical protein
MTVSFADEEPNGLAVMLGGLIEANLHRHPDRRALLRPAVVGLRAKDAGVGVTLTLSLGSVAVANGASANGRAHLRVETDSASLIELSATPLRLGLPDPFSRQGRDLVRKLLGREIRIDGMLRHPVRLVRLNKLLSVV